MKKLTAQDYLEIRCWMHQNARPVDLAVWNHHFEGGSAVDLVRELAHYQNEDGGFGHALEADCWNPSSSPYTTLYAMNMLHSVGCLKSRHPMMEKIFQYIDTTMYCTDEGWLFSIPSNDFFPRAPWWSYDEEANAYESIGVTAELSGLILLHGDRESNLYKKALAFAGAVIEKLKTPGRYGDMGIGGFCVLLENIKKAGLMQSFPCDFLEEMLKSQVNRTMERDPEKWAQYSVRPSDYIKTPECPYCKANKEAVETELDYLIDTRPAKGVWPIPWSWFENNTRYPKEYAISENWWKAVKATEKTLLLKRFGRLEAQPS